jgi:hypothetical protein
MKVVKITDEYLFSLLCSDLEIIYIHTSCKHLHEYDEAAHAYILWHHLLRYERFGPTKLQHLRVEISF